MARLAPSLQRFLALPPADRRLGPFVLVEQLGRGGSAPVWLAREVHGETELRAAAVKLFALDGPAAARERVVAEARALCRVEHPSVVRFYALPMDEARGVMGLAMEHVAGTPLHERLAARGRLRTADALAMGAAVASALAAVHRAGLVHRDVKPANVVDAAGGYKLIDFGIAAADARDGAGPRPRRAPARLGNLPAEAVGARLSTLGVTTPLGSEDPGSATVSLGVTCGTVGYIDPAVIAEGEPATAASDLYALGAMLFECLAGRLPAASAEGGGLLGEILDGRAPPPPLRVAVPDAPEPLARLVDALLAPSRGDRPASAEEVAIALDRIRHEGAGSPRAMPPESLGPFRGLGRFKEGDRDVYFGRSSEIAASLEVLRGRGLLALIGPSGSGKSSLARAGVLPRLAEGALGGQPEAWDTAIAEPGTDPRAAVVASLAPFVPRAGDRAPEALVLSLAARARETGRGLVLLVDQLEELATIAAGPSRDWTASLLAALAEQPLPGVRAVVTARRDLLDPLLAVEGLGRALLRSALLIEPMAEIAISAALAQALAAYGYALEDEALRGEIAAEIGRMGSAMPLVQFALTELWDRRDRAAKRVTRAGLAAMGGLAGALERHAEATLAELSEEIHGAPEAAREVLLALTTAQGTRASRTAAELERAAGPLAGEVIEALERARLLVAGAEGVTLAHEALLASWGRLRRWVEEAREDRLLAEELERDAARWGDRPALAPPWRRLRLSAAEELARRGAALSADALAFVRAGRRAERRTRLATAGVAAAALLAAAGGGGAYVRAVQAREEATRRALAEETRSREQAERQTREMREAQARIDELVRDLKAAPDPMKLRELEQRLAQARAITEAHRGGALPLPVRTVAPGPSPSGPWLPEFTLRREAGDEGLRLLAAAERCRERGLALCTETQWTQACAADPEVGALETWTVTAEADQGFVVRGGGGCDARLVAGGASPSPSRAGVCCSRAVSVESSNKSPLFLDATSKKLLAFEAASSPGSEALGALLADTIQLQATPAMKREQVIGLIRAEHAAHPDSWMVLDTCAVSFDTGRDTWTADCRKAAQQGGAVTQALTRLVWSGREGRIVSITAPGGMRGSGAP